MSKEENPPFFGKITANQVPKTRVWLHSFEMENNVTIKLDEDGTFTMAGKKEVLEAVSDALDELVAVEDYKHALEIIGLAEKYPDYLQMMIPFYRVSALSDPKLMTTLSTFQKMMNCVIKVDRTGHITIFGEPDHNVTISEQIEKFMHDVEEKAKKASADAGATSLAARQAAAVAAATVLALPSQSETDSLPVNYDTASAIDDAMEGKLQDSFSETPKDIPNKKDNQTGFGAATFRLTGGRGNSGGFENNSGFGSNSGVLNRSPTPGPYQAKLAVDEKDTGRMLGSQHRNRTRLENQYNCQIRLDRHKDTSGVMVYITGKTQAEVDAAKNDILEMLKKPATWEPKERRQSSKSNFEENRGFGSSTNPDRKAGGDG